MKNIIFVFLLFSSFYSFSQQILWSTTEIEGLKSHDVKLIPISDVTEKILDYYEFYNCYYDLSGFSKDGLEEFLKKSSSTNKLIPRNPKVISNEPFAIAYKGNDGHGSNVIVMLVQKDNIDLIQFSNEVGRGAISSYDINKFKKWLYSFWNIQNKTHSENRNSTVTDIEMEHNLVNRSYVIRPNITYENNYSGKVVLEIAVNRKGKVVSVRPGVKGTTFSSHELFMECEKAFLNAQFNEIKDGPERQIGNVVINFKNR